ncbi:MULTISPECIES: 3-oxoacid CoA-transferase subunit B [Planococcaceae]|uniref:Succinyl-CoA--3-ketoacid-CoA transferase n=1 Tax=Planococcus halotolerans TaxID=2233542 RepID=A0A365L6W6_9BACL|nr:MULTISPECIES: 3-oxoacid CoA-transferase subunit B [Planococcaceae]RAZ81148.1 succinyl-CoA--3-ketoacid-CoA transferase [Planococcus halotolerans]RLQ90200.1 3-oxoacid CoA-transferase subunit B [Planomicrobium sp. Y74]
MSQQQRIKIARRIAEEFEDNQIINLGVGIPTLIPDYIEGKDVYLHSENGLLGMGPTPEEEFVNMDLISASKKPVSVETGASIFDSSDSFLMIRGGHVDVAVLGTLQVDETGEVANWAVPGQNILGVGGAMDLVAGAKKIIIATMHTSKDGTPKLLKKLTFPSSGVRKVDMIVTEHAVFEFKDEKMFLIEVLSDITLEELKEITPASYELSTKKLIRV